MTRIADRIELPIYRKLHGKTLALCVTRVAIHTLGGFEWFLLLPVGEIEVVVVL